MTVHTLVRRLFVNYNLFIPDQFDVGVALVARNISVPTGQGEVSPGVVIESGRNPARSIVAIIAMCRIVLGNELANVGVFVARLALFGRSFEPGLVSGGGLVTISTTNRAVSAKQGEFGFRMIEAVDVGPRFDGVTGLAAKRRAIGPLTRHVFIEFALVRIFMAGGAGTVFEFEGKNLIGAASESDLMAVRASHGRMCASQGVARIAMLLDRVRSAVPVGHRMAIFTAVLVRSPGELIVVRILMTVGAKFEFNFVNRILARGNVALGAVHLDVRAL